MSIVFAAISTKGGVGKTTLLANVGGLLADIGDRVLLVDADTQPSLTSYYAFEYEAPRGLVEVVTGARAALEFRLAGVTIDIPYALGTAQADAFFAGLQDTRSGALLSNAPSFTLLTRSRRRNHDPAETRQSPPVFR